MFGLWSKKNFFSPGGFSLFWVFPLKTGFFWTFFGVGKSIYNNRHIFWISSTSSIDRYVDCKNFSIYSEFYILGGVWPGAGLFQKKSPKKKFFFHIFLETRKNLLQKLAELFLISIFKKKQYFAPKKKKSSKSVFCVCCIYASLWILMKLHTYVVKWCFLALFLFLKKFYKLAFVILVCFSFFSFDLPLK